MDSRLSLAKEKFFRYQMRLKYVSPQSQIREKQQYLADMEEKLRQGVKRRMEQAKGQLELYGERLKGLSPLHKLQQGFSYASDKSGKTLVSISQAERGDLLTLQVTDGTLKAQVEEICPGACAAGEEE